MHKLAYLFVILLRMEKISIRSLSRQGDGDAGRRRRLAENDHIYFLPSKFSKIL